MGSVAKPSVTKGTASDAEKLKTLKDFPGLYDEFSLVRNVVKSLNENKDEDESKGTLNMADAEKLDKLLYNHWSVFIENEICRQMIGDVLAETNAVSILMKYMNILTKDGSDYPLDGYNQKCYKIIRLLLLAYTDASPNLCKQVAKNGMLKTLLHDMKHFQKTFKSNDEKRKIVTSAMDTFNNCSRVSENIKYFNEINSATTVAWYVQNTADDIENSLAIASMMTLSYIVDEANNDDILADESIIQRFLKLLEISLANPSGRCNEGFSYVEMVRALTRLANNNKNSATMVQKGILNSLLKMMEGSDEEKFVATEAVWGLAFADVNKKKLETFQNGKIMEYLRNFLKLQSTELQNAATGALWIIELARKAQEKHQQSQASKRKCKGHVMISYQWDCQDIVKKVRDLLKSKGINVWMDIDRMEGSILDGMADAVENASVVLVCLSQKYKDSHSCRTEGEYVYRTEKPIIPVLVERKYKADGWLGLLVGAKLYYDLSDHQKFKDNISKLVKALSSKKYLG